MDNPRDREGVEGRRIGDTGKEKEQDETNEGTCTKKGSKNGREGGMKPHGRATQPDLTKDGISTIRYYIVRNNR